VLTSIDWVYTYWRVLSGNCYRREKYQIRIFVNYIFHLIMGYVGCFHIYSIEWLGVIFFINFFPFISMFESLFDWEWSVSFYLAFVYLYHLSFKGRNNFIRQMIGFMLTQYPTCLLLYLFTDIFTPLCFTCLADTPVGYFRIVLL
jgi:hypothetical protein